MSVQDLPAPAIAPFLPPFPPRPPRALPPLKLLSTARRNFLAIFEEEAFELLEMRQSVVLLIRQLPVRERELLYLRFFVGQSQSQIGEKLGIYRDYPVSKGCTSPFAPIWINEMVRRQG